MDTPSDMIDLASNYDGPTVSSSKTPTVSYPSLYISGCSEDIPIEVGDEVYAMVVLKKKSETNSEDETGKIKYTCSFDVLAIKPLGDVEDDSESDDNQPSSASDALKSDMEDAMESKAGEY